MQKTRGFFSKVACERVSGVSGHPIRNGRPGLREGGGEGRPPDLGEEAVVDMAGGEELTGVSGSGATGHQTAIRKHREREEEMASPSQGKTGPRKWPARRSAAAPWPAPRSSWLGR